MMQSVKVTKGCQNTPRGRCAQVRNIPEIMS